ncbi:translation initiation factor IF-2 [Taibaiella sp. KBW10]|uniref:translation initiation factor IF-2 n=1 Tax=Taibaiella sp. KBW10 TaxID=2153357 RepID=UPI000F5B3530|nr:translation initiation factor IF-2 [Taibaiella sp. KBW10]RQO30261.1 translation initiation factor IF-2 [Taibaiella sp. KBW10]
MSETSNTPRLLAAAKEFNIGKETLVDFLVKKGFEIDSKPSAKITEDMYNALQNEFAKDRAAKRKSDAIALPKGSLMESLHKPKEELDLTAKEKKETVAKPKTSIAEAPSTEEAPVTPPTPAAPVVVEEVKAPVAPVKEEQEAKPPKEETPKAPPVEEKPVVVEEAVAKEVPAAPAKVEEAPKAAEAPKAEPVVVPPAAVPVAEEPAQHIDTKSPKLSGPKVLDKIDLEAMNLATRPKKGTTAKKKEEPKKENTPEPVKENRVAPVANPVVIHPIEQPKVTEAPKDAVVPPAAKEAVVPPAVQLPAKPEHIEMNAPRLAGPKILGKIELPVKNDNSRESREKRKRKRIPVDNKKPETGNNNTGNTNNNRPQGTGNQGGQRPPGQGGNFNRPGGGQGQQGGNRPGGGPGGPNRNNNFRGNDRRNTGPGGRSNTATQQPQEVDAKAIQDKIRETQAKLAGGGAKNKNLKAKYRRNKREEMAEKRAAAEAEHDGSVIQVTEFISVSELASLLDVSFTEVISKCMSLGIMVSINQRLDAEVIELVANEFDREVEFINLQQDADEEVEEEEDLEDTDERAPVVTIMGHVDHGKTSLLDYIRNASVVAGEAGGITQHIGAYRVTTDSGKKITFLDTPGHEAFTAMRARGAKAADVAVIVVAADDAIMPQTREAISHAQAAGLPMVFAINKIDKDGSNPEKIKEQLSAMNILVEDWGGKFQSQEISAKKGIGIDELLEKILLESELLELKANSEKVGTGSIIEASLDKGRGYVSTMLVQNGTLNMGDMIVSGQYFGKVKAMFNERGQRVQQAGPSTPVQVLGLNGAPQAGEKFKVYADEAEAKEIANRRSQILREQGIRTRKHITLDEIGRRLALGNFKELNVIIKGDFDGSVEALSDSLQKLSTEEVVVSIVHKGVGQITESDVLLASASDAIILGFQVRPSSQAAKLADQENIEIRYYSIIYDAIDEIKSAMEGMLEPTIEKKVVGNIEIREVFKISGVGSIAGCYVLDGKFTRNTKINIIRDGIVVHHGELASLKRFKDDVKEVSAGYECGLSIKNFNDIRVNDIIEGYEEVEVKRTL